MGGVTYDLLLVSGLYRLFIIYDTKSVLAVSTDTGMQIDIQSMTIVSVLNDIFVFG